MTLYVSLSTLTLPYYSFCYTTPKMALLLLCSSHFDQPQSLSFVPPFFFSFRKWKKDNFWIVIYANDVFSSWLIWLFAKLKMSLRKYRICTVFENSQNRLILLFQWFSNTMVDMMSPSRDHILFRKKAKLLLFTVSWCCSNFHSTLTLCLEVQID